MAHPELDNCVLHVFEHFILHKSMFLTRNCIRFHFIDLKLVFIRGGSKKDYKILLRYPDKVLMWVHLMKVNVSFENIDHPQPVILFVLQAKNLMFVKLTERSRMVNFLVDIIFYILRKIKTQ